MDWSQIVNLCVQIPLVILVVWYSLEMNKQYRAELDKRDAAWMEFLREERMQRKESAAELARNMTEHDIRAQERHLALLKRIVEDKRIAEGKRKREAGE